jgi:hypothetical protein
MSVLQLVAEEQRMTVTTDKNRRQSIATRRCRRSYPFEVCSVCGTQYALDAAHLDGKPANNDPANLAWLCKSHHWLFDHHGLPVVAIKILRDWWQGTRGEPGAERRRVLADRARRANATTRKQRLAPGKRGQNFLFEPLGVPKDTP